MIAGAHTSIALIGFMCAGKTTTGAELAGRLDLRFVDADAELERDAGRSIPTLFDEEGEAAFREREERVARRLLEAGGTLVALGGGAVVSAGVREALRRHAYTILLDVSAETAWRRVEEAGAERPLARDRARFLALHAERRPLYEAAADALVDADREAADAALVAPLARAEALAELPRLVAGRRFALLADARVLELVRTPGEPLVTVALPPGEAAKTLGCAGEAWMRLAEAGLERSDVVVGLGGGAATDVAGFVAATYARGVPWIAVPTTLLGMVDAGIGGKTAVDLPAAKNQVGAFHQPEWVVCDPATLATLSRREWAAGFAEVVKTALLAGGPLWELVRGWRADVPADEQQQLELIRRTAAYKAYVVAADPTERGLRAVLNLGHTVGHALEVASGYARLLHGEAVAIGLRAALFLSRRCAGLDEAVEAAAGAALAAAGLPRAAPGIDPEAVLAAMARDKKARGGRPRFVLLEALGRPVTGVDPGDELVREAVARAVGAPAPAVT